MLPGILVLGSDHLQDSLLQFVLLEREWGFAFSLPLPCALVCNGEEQYIREAEAAGLSPGLSAFELRGKVLRQCEVGFQFERFLPLWRLLEGSFAKHAML